MATPLLTTKLYMPPIRPERVPRPQLIDHLNEGLHSRLILVSAPAGFGKTTLVSAWIKQSRIPAAWISLEESDNDPARFLAYLVAALRTIEGEIGRGALTALESPQPPATEALLTGLINELNAIPHPTILALDDYHLITAQPIHNAVTFLLDHLPPQMHVVVATRGDPPLPIARLRGRGLLTELRQTDLRFSLDEATAFLNEVMELDLSSGEVAALSSRTEGWITGLQMAALALQAAVSAEHHRTGQVTSFIQEFAGSNRYVLDYLVEEVLEHQPEGIQSFLLQTAILDRLSGPLCDAVLEIGDWGLETDPSEERATIAYGQTPIPGMPSPSQQILEQLDAANLFIIPLDNERQWYRYHRLFADLLRRRLQQLRVEQVPLLHRRASAWYEQNGLLAEAIDHALAAQAHERAADLVEQVAEATLMRSEIATLLNWVDRLPEALVQARPSLCLFHAWALLWSGQPLDTIQSRVRDLDTSDEATAAKVAAFQAYLATWQGQVSRAGEMAQQALDGLPEDEQFLRTVATLNLGMSYLLRGDVETGRRIFDRLARMGEMLGNVLIAVNALCHMAELQMSRAQLHDAEDLYRQALQLATDAEGRPLPIAGMALIGLGDLSREWNDLEAATGYLTEGIEQMGQWSSLGALDGHLSLARTKQAQGDAKGAREMLDRAEQIAVQFDVTELDDQLVAIHRVRLWLSQGNSEAAWRWLEDRGYRPEEIEELVKSGVTSVAEGKGTGADLSERAQPEDYIEQQLRNYECILLARALLAQDRPVDALSLLESRVALLEQHGRKISRRMIEVQNLRALALQAQGEVDQALVALEQALSIGEPGGFVRTFVDEGEPMLQLLRQAASHGILPGYVRQLITAFELPAPRQAAGTAPPREPHSPVVQPLVEPLSERELDVLRLLATGMSNPEIADQLFIATSTVRSHLKSIYGKLNVHRRWDAVQRAEELGLI
jgi:LuxR family maltose regulon positive regulatory protein